MIAQIQRLFDHLAWADDGVLAAFRRSNDGQPRALGLYSHVLGAEHVWLARLEVRAAKVAVWPELTVAECGALAVENHSAYETFIAKLDDDALRREVEYRNSAGAPFTSRIEDVLLHVAMHGSYHRGQVAMLLRHACGSFVAKPARRSW